MNNAEDSRNYENIPKSKTELALKYNAETDPPLRTKHFSAENSSIVS